MQKPIDVDANLFRLCYPYVSKEKTRYYLMGVYVTPHPEGGVLMVATNGHVAIAIHDESGYCAAPAIVEVSKPVLAACKPKKDCKTRLRADMGEVIVYVQQGKFEEEAIAISSRPFIEGTYPDYRRVFPRDMLDHGACSSAYAPAYMAMAAKTCADLNSRALQMNSGKESPGVVRFVGHENIVVIIMPWRSDGNTGLHTMPDFVHQTGHELKLIEKAA